MTKGQKGLFSPQRRAKRQKYYDHRIWRRIRKIQLRKAPLCEICKKEGSLTVATVCDHISPLWTDWQGFIKGPFQSLCKKCHETKSIESDLPRLRRADKLKMEVWGV